MTCPRCAQKNEKTAAYCSACGQQISFTPVASPVVDWSLWRRFVGPRADYYLKRFETFQKGTSDRFRPTWNWPAFGVGWLWYLYRKMYLHAAVFLFGGLLPIGMGNITSETRGARFSRSSANNSCRKVEPLRGMPVMNTGR